MSFHKVVHPVLTEEAEVAEASDTAIRLTLGTATSSTLSATQNCRRRGSRTSGASKGCLLFGAIGTPLRLFRSECEIETATGKGFNKLPPSTAEQERADVARAKTNLSFNWRLVLAPEFVLRYLVTHEAHRAATAGNPSLVHRRDDFIERQVRLPGNQRK